ncbi:hypothetical protein [Arenibacter troitsensis]|uniref:hypothetical protein n=1 Tax=Arenibacter troitsensis TaxID=188872 RepID=UPI000A1CE4B1|nr:hypothetical protein [Arenibacter troitsensis]
MDWTWDGRGQTASLGYFDLAIWAMPIATGFPSAPSSSRPVVGKESKPPYQRWGAPFFNFLSAWFQSCKVFLTL